MITGARGWIGRAAVELLAARCAGASSPPPLLFGQGAGEVATHGGLRLPVHPLAELRREHVDGALLLHLAFLTKEKVAALGEADFLRINREIDDTVLGALAGSRCRGVFVASSGAAGQAERGEGRELYGLTKLLQEERFLRWGTSAEVPVLAGRIFNIAGPYINKVDSYALSSFLIEAARRGRITVQARTPVFRSYLHVNDLCELALRTLDAGAVPSRPVDLCGALVTEMADVAGAAAAATGLAPQAVTRAPVDWSRPSAYLGRPEATLTLAGAAGMRLIPFDRQVSDTASHLGVLTQTVDTRSTRV